MHRQLQKLLAVALVCAAPASFASTIGVTGAPSLEIFWRNPAIVGAPTQFVGEVPLTVDADGNIAGDTQSFSWTWSGEEDTITVSYAGGNLDPFLNFSFGVVDSGSASIFTFVYSSPVAPMLMGAVNYTVDLAGSFSNGSPNNGGSLGMAAPNTINVLEALLDGNLVDGAGGGASFGAGGSSIYGPFAAAGTFDCSAIGGCTNMSTRLSFIGSGGDDAYSFTGRFEITPVPVPTAVWLLGSAIGVLGWVRRRSA